MIDNLIIDDLVPIIKSKFLLPETNFMMQY